MRKAFLEFLISNETIPASWMDDIRTLLRGAPEPIGAIAFSYGMITGGDIDIILDEQRKSHRRFGEIAMELGMLKRGQVDALLQVQELRAATETAEALALSGICPIVVVMKELGRFLNEEICAGLLRKLMLIGICLASKMVCAKRKASRELWFA